MCNEPFFLGGAEEATTSQTILLSEFLLETWYICMLGRPPAQSMFMNLWKPTYKLLGTTVKRSAVYVKVETSSCGVARGDRSSVEDKGPRR